ncbi:Epl1/Sm1 [Trichoderma simmonsii]|uniref:Epl1/Sm1 n=1 Tax=Trichoderma simmonsii TaxID=1491479 RepID=A0A8G0P9M1_9HYPO|nr:Epl1/Sm1 [Trichoderma simmonsii]
MATLPPPPDGINLDESRRASIMVTSIVTWILAVIVVGLRILSRRMKNISLWIDDWLIIAALVPSCAHVFGMGVYAVSRGLGKHVWADPPDAQYAWAIGLFIAELGYFVTIACVKWSILAFYWRSFKIRSSVKIPIYILAIIVLLWATSVILVTIFQCQPTSAWWNRFNPTHPLQPDQYKCTVDSVKFFYGNAIPTIVTDVLMLALPLPYITKLQLPKGQKWALAGIFLVGLFVTIVSIVRLHYLLQGNLTSPDITWNFVDIALWSVLEGNVAIFCGKQALMHPISLTASSEITIRLFGR